MFSSPEQADISAKLPVPTDRQDNVLIAPADMDQCLCISASGNVALLTFIKISQLFAGYVSSTYIPSSIIVSSTHSPPFIVYTEFNTTDVRKKLFTA